MTKNIIKIFKAVKVQKKKGLVFSGLFPLCLNNEFIKPFEKGPPVRKTGKRVMIGNIGQFFLGFFLVGYIFNN